MLSKYVGDNRVIVQWFSSNISRLLTFHIIVLVLWSRLLHIMPINKYMTPSFNDILP